MLKKIIYIILILVPVFWSHDFFLFGEALDQQNISDSLQVEITKKSNNSLDTTIIYNGDFIDYFSDKNMIILSKNAFLQYQDMILTADTIKVDLNKKLIYASLSKDTIFKNNTSNVIDSIIINGLPTIRQNNEIVSGKKMVYDMNTKQGKIEYSQTIMKNATIDDNTYFRSKNMIKLDNNEINGCDVRISSCSLEEPHYYFKADSAVVTKDNWVFAKPITLYFGHVPVGYFPFILYKRDKGRNSGLILPSYTYSSTKGNGLKHLGFFWDISDYMDYTALIDYYDYYGYLLTQEFRYNLRYILNGHLNASFNNDHSTHNWRLIGNHHHNITPSMTFDMNINYVTSTSLVDKLSETDYDRMQNTLYSNARFYKKWQNSGDNLDISSAYTQYVDTAIVKYTFPSIKYNFSGRKPFKKISNLPTIIKDFNIASGLSLTRNSNIDYDKNIFDEKSNYMGSLSESMTQKKLNISPFKNSDFILGDLSLSSSQRITGFYYKARMNKIEEDDNFLELSKNDTTDNNKAVLTTQKIKLSRKVFGYFNLSETFKYRKDFAFKYYDEDKQIVNDLKSRDIYDLSASVNTKVYGIFQPNFYALKKIRHTITPTLSFTYMPEYKNDYYKTYMINDSTESTYDQFGNSLIGGSPSEKKMTLTYGLSNLFEAKIGTIKDDGTENLKNRNLFNLKFGGYYNFARDSNQMSDVSARLTSDIYKGNIFYDLIKLNANIESNAVFSPYYEFTNQYINKNFDFWNENPFRLKSYDFSYNLGFPFSLKGLLNKNTYSKTEKYFTTYYSNNDSDDGFDDNDSTNSTVNISHKVDKNLTKIVFDLGGSLNFYEKYFANDNTKHGYDKKFSISLNATVTPTENWRITYNSTFNLLTDKKVTATRITVHRDIHCWQADFEWDILKSGFKLTINTKSSIFSDLKFEKDTRKIRW